MPRVDLDILKQVDAGLMAAGAVSVLGFVYVLARRRWRNPLAGIRPLDGPELWWPFVIWVGQGLLVYLSVKPVRFSTPGSADFHKAEIISDATKLLMILPGAYLLARHRSFAKRPVDLARTGKFTLLGIPIALASLAVCTTQLRMCKSIWYWFAPQVEQPTHVVLTALEHSEWGGWGAVQLTISAVLVAPLFEEVLFRGLLLQSFWRYSEVAWPAVIVSGVAFGFIHMTQPQDVLPLVTFGLILGFVRVRTGRLWLCVLAHSLFNLRTMALAVLNPQILNAGL